MNGREGVAVAWGYTLDHLQRLAGIAAKRAFGSDMGHPERVETAIGAIGETLATATSRPTAQELVQTGGKAIREQIGAERHHHGVHHGMSMRGYHAYWTPPASDPFDERICDRLACRQIFVRLTPPQRQAILALGLVDGDTHAAAAMLGWTHAKLRAHVKQARRAFWRHWYQGQTPPKGVWVADRGPSLPLNAIAQRRRQRHRDAKAAR
jgi:hypothetical protein